MNTSTTRKECMEMPLKDLVEYYEDLADEAEKEAKRISKQQEGR